MSIPKPAFSMEPNSYKEDASVSLTATESSACTSSVECQKRLDAICTTFEQQWGNPDTASIEALVNAAEPSEREPLFDELISIEQEMLVRRGQPVDRQHYFKRFPAYQSRLNIIFARFDSETLPRYSLTAESDSRYVRETVLARGGMGIVYRAWDRLLNRQVAIKVLDHELADDEEARARFRREPRLCGGLQHPNVIPVYDAGTTRDGSDFFVMKLIHGKTLSECLRENGVSKHGLHWLPIFQQVTHAIASAHRQGIYHRDIKPSNVMVANYGEVYVMDWGLSGFKPTTEQSPKSIDSNSPLPPSLTDGGKFFGTPNYMPPELELPGANRSTPQVDIYGLGALLCELLVGRTPRQITGEASAPNCLKHVESELDRHGIDRELKGILLKCIALQAEERYPTVTELADSLDGYHAQVSQRIRKAEQDAEMAVHRSRLINLRWRTVGISIAMLAILAVTGLWMQGRIDRVHRERLNEATRALDRAEQAYLSACDTENIYSPDWQFIFEASENARLLVEKHGDAPLIERAAFLQKQLKLLTELSHIQDVKFDTALSRFDSETYIDSSMSAFIEYGLAPETMTTQEGAAYLLAMPPQAQKIIVGVLFHIVTSGGIEESDWWRQLTGDLESRVFGSALINATANRDAETMLEFVYNERLELLSGPVLNCLARALTEAKEYEAAEQVYRTAIKKFPVNHTINNSFGVFLAQSQPPRHREALRFLSAAAAIDPNPGSIWNLADCYVHNGNQDLAMQLLEDLVIQHPEYDDGVVRFAELLIDEDKLAKAETVLLTAIRGGGQDAHMFHLMGRIALKNGKWRSAETYFEKAKMLGQNDIGLRAAVASSFGLVGRADKAIEEFTSLLNDAPDYAETHYDLANCLREIEDFEQAKVTLERYIEIEPSSPEAHCNLGFWFRLLGRPDEPLECYIQGHRLSQYVDNWEYPSATWIEETKQEIEFLNNQEARLNDVVKFGRSEEIRHAVLFFLRPQKEFLTAFQLYQSHQSETSDCVPMFFVRAAGIAAELIANHPNSTFHRKLHGKTTEELAFESTEVGLEVVEQMIVWLEQAIDSWETNAETPNDLAARLYELRLVSQLRSLETLRDPQFDASLPESYRNIVSTFWTRVRDQKLRLESRIE